MKNLFKKLLEKLLEKPLRKLAQWAVEQNAAADAAREAERRNESDAGGMGVPASPSSEAGVSDPLAGSSSENPPPSSKPWRECRLSSNWADGASKRMTSVSPPPPERMPRIGARPGISALQATFVPESGRRRTSALVRRTA